MGMGTQRVRGKHECPDRIKAGPPSEAGKRRMELPTQTARWFAARGGGTSLLRLYVKERGRAPG